MAEEGRFEKFVLRNELYSLFHKYYGLGRLLNFVDPKEANQRKKILEMGCGSGVTTELIASKFKKSKIIGLDRNDFQIKIAMARQHLKNVNFMVGDARNLKFPPNSFDMVFEVFTFHHISDYKKAINSAYKVLRKGGKFVAIDFQVNTSNHFHKFLSSHDHRFLKEEFIDKLKQTGFIMRIVKGRMIFVVEAIKPK